MSNPIGSRQGPTVSPAQRDVWIKFDDRSNSITVSDVYGKSAAAAKSIFDPAVHQCILIALDAMAPSVDAVNWWL
ncbi:MULTISPECIES: hypothetical protein [Burkholderiaceae]|uniref:hypothetical protein n=1 Tax=Burkholderiaceae TaxID=119060 RepID=UPI0011156425|nr:MULTISPECIES: hypothetical protein [Burkholderiaceae]MCG1019951.1 hypothetical protein [Mycetohabitans sp. B4]